MSSVGSHQGVGDVFSLKVMQEVILDMMLKVDLMLDWVAMGLSLVGSEGPKEGKGINLKDVGANGLSLMVVIKKANDLKGKNVMVGPGLGKGLKRVWRIKKHLSVSGFLGLASLCTTVLIPAQKVLEVA